MRKPTTSRLVRILALSAVVLGIGAIAPVAAQAAGETNAAPDCQTSEHWFRGDSASWNVADLCTDPEGDQVYITSVQVPSTGTITAGSSTIGYTPAPDHMYGYTEEIRFQATDGTNTVSGRFQAIPVHPGIGTAVADAFTVKPGQSITFDPRANDLDAANNLVWIHGSTLGQLTENEDGTLTYTAPVGWTGVDTTSYQLAFAGYGGPEQVNITFTVAP